MQHDQAIVRRRAGADPGDLWRSGCLDRGSRPASPIRGTAVTPARGAGSAIGPRDRRRTCQHRRHASAWRRTDDRAAGAAAREPRQARRAGCAPASCPRGTRSRRRRPERWAPPRSRTRRPMCTRHPARRRRRRRRRRRPEQCPLVHCTSNLHGAPGAAAFAGPHTPSSPETLSSARQRSFAAQVRSQQIPSSQCPLVHSSPRVHAPGSSPSLDRTAVLPGVATSASAEPASRFSTPSEKR